MNSYYIECGGGLGDLIMVYLCRNNPKDKWSMPTTDVNATNWFRRLKSFKQKHGNSKIIINMRNHNQASKALLQYNPYIDEINHMPWVKPGTDLLPWNNGKPLAGHFSPSEFEEEDTVIHTTDADKKTIESITGRYICIHPFARGTYRDVMSFDQWKYVIDGLIDYGHKVVVIGQSYMLHVAENRHKVNEEFPYERDGLTNLVNQCSVRASINVVFNCTWFIGYHSSMLIPAWFKERQSTCIVPGDDKYMVFWNSNNPTLWAKDQHFNRMFYVRGEVKEDMLDAIIQKHKVFG